MYNCTCIIVYTKNTKNYYKKNTKKSRFYQIKMSKLNSRKPNSNREIVQNMKVKQNKKKLETR